MAGFFACTKCSIVEVDDVELLLLFALAAEFDRQRGDTCR